MNSEDLNQELEWIEAAKRDMRHFAPLFEKYKVDLYRYAYQRCGDATLADDFTMDTFVKAMEKLHTYQYRGKPLLAWLFTIARNVINEYFRQNSTEKRPVLVAPTDLAAMVRELVEPKLETPDSTPMLLDCMQALPLDKLELIEWFHFEKRSYREIAEMINISGENEAEHPGEWQAVSENTVKVRAKRVRDKLKACIQKKIKAEVGNRQ